MVQRLEDIQRQSLDQTTFENRAPVLQQYGLLIADQLRSGGHLAVDIDGVVCQSDALEWPWLTTPRMITAMRAIEAQGVDIGPATARGDSILDFLRNTQGLQMKGPAILEEGQVLIRNGVKEYLALPNHIAFIADLRRTLSTHPECKGSWPEVQDMFRRYNAFSFCPGNFQWQGECRASFWFEAHGEEANDQIVLASIFEPIIQEVALRNRLDFQHDIAVSASRMSVGNLGMISIKGKVDGLPVDKGTAARLLSGKWAFAADGFGDKPLAVVTKERGGAVIGIKGNLDVSNQSPEFLREADAVLEDPVEFALALQYAALYLH